MIRLVASDIDGTLLQGDAKTLPEALFPLIRRLAQQGIAFCAASGRQYTSLRRLFAPVADEIYYLCENGAIVYGKGEAAPVLGKTAMDRALAEQLIGEIVARPECEVLISGANISYLMPKAQEVVTHIRDFTENNIALIQNPGEIQEDIIKVSAFCVPDTRKTEAELAPKWNRHFRGAVAGLQWLDFTLADKGVGIRTLCQSLNILPEEVMAFGDNFNDVPMLETVGHPVLMETAHPALLARFPVQCGNVPAFLENRFFKE